MLSEVEVFEPLKDLWIFMCWRYLLLPFWIDFDEWIPLSSIDLNSREWLIDCILALYMSFSS